MQMFVKKSFCGSTSTLYRIHDKSLSFYSGERVNIEHYIETEDAYLNVRTPSGVVNRVSKEDAFIGSVFEVIDEVHK